MKEEGQVKHYYLSFSELLEWNRKNQRAQPLLKKEQIQKWKRLTVNRYLRLVRDGYSDVKIIELVPHMTKEKLERLKSIWKTQI